MKPRHIVMILAGVRLSCGVKSSGAHDGHAPAATPAAAPVPAPAPPPPGEATAAAALAARVVGTSSEQFMFELIPLASVGADRFELPVSPEGKIKIQGTSGVALASAFHWYLKYFAGVDVMYGNVRVPSSAIPLLWPGVNSSISMESPVQWRYYMNVVTHSYAAAWWDWSRWEQEIDWMAMMGINMPLAFTGQEYIWDKLYREKFGLTEEDLAEHFAGPAFLAWGRMGNIRGWGGWMDGKDGRAGVNGLTANWMKQQAGLQRSIVARERSLGMRTVLPGFAGHVPLALARNATLSRSNGWNGFKERYSQDGLLDVSDPLFKEIGAAFIEMQTSEFGTDHIYNGDTFNEMKPSRSDADYVASWGAAVYDAMRAGDAEAVWFVQGWSLKGWSDDELTAYWSKVPSGRLLSLDLNCAQSGGSWKKYTAQISPPRTVVCGLLDNMGGKRALGGNLDLLAHQLLDNIDSAGQDDDGKPLIGGLGWNPEDMHQNPIKWHLLGEVGWRGREHSITNISDWVRQYAVARYAPHGRGQDVQSAWDLLHDAAYRRANHATSFAANGVCQLPKFHLGTTQSNDPDKVIAAAQMLIQAAHAEPGLQNVQAFKYDLVDVIRQTLQDRFADAYTTLADACGDSGKEFLDTFTRAVPQGASNCAGNADASLRMPGCGHEFGSPCDPLAVQAWCENLTQRVPGSAPCTMASTNGYIWTSAPRSQPFQSYALDCYIRDTAVDPKCVAAINTSGSDILELAVDLDKVLATDEHFLLGRWIHDARSWGATLVEEDWLEWNARVQVTLWGTLEANGARISDYAAKQWAGLVSGYYAPLWQHFFGGVAKGVDANVLHKEILLLAEQWTNSTTENYPTEPVGDVVDTAAAIIAKWFGFYSFI